jgi:hypothetical protein
MQRQSRTSCSRRCASSLGPHMLGKMLGNVGGIAVPVAPATLVQAADFTRDLAAGCMRDRAEACTLARAVACTPAQAAECMLVLEEVSTLGLGVDCMPALGVESILARHQMMATKVHGGLASREPKAANGPGRTVLTETLSCLFEIALTLSSNGPSPAGRPRRAAHVERSAAKSYWQGRASMCRRQ